MIPDHRRLRINPDGWCPQAAHLPSPNADTRPPDIVPDLLVIHNISLPPGEYGGPWIADLFLNRLNCDAHPYFDQLRDHRVSAHFLIRRNGELVQFVSANDRAWHAGASSFQGRDRCNDFSIGIELEGTDFEAFTPEQYAMLADLTSALRRKYPLSDVVGHEHIAPSRKTDPGPCFDWRLYRASLEKLRTPRAALHFPTSLGSG